MIIRVESCTSQATEGREDHDGDKDIIAMRQRPVGSARPSYLRVPFPSCFIADGVEVGGEGGVSPGPRTVLMFSSHLVKKLFLVLNYNLSLNT